MNSNKKLTEHLYQFITENKKKRFEEVLQQRTKHLTVVMEDVYQPQNISAVLRSCDCFGLQDLHVIEKENHYKVNPRIVMGASKWVDVHHHGTTSSCIESLKKQEYQIVATTPHHKETDVSDFIPDKKTAIFFGTEYEGLSDEVLEKADKFITIPMHGFTESFNISVAAALIVSTTMQTLRKSNIDWQLTEREKELIRMDWAKKCIKGADVIEAAFIEEQNELF